MIQNQILSLTIIACAVLWGGALIAAVAWIIADTLMRLIIRPLDDTPVPYWPADDLEALIPIVMCPRCRDAPRPGSCSCWGACGHPACLFAHVDLTPPSEAEERFFNGKGAMP